MHTGRTDHERSATPETGFRHSPQTQSKPPDSAASNSQSKGLAISETRPVLPAQPKFDRLPECVRCGLPPQIAAALDKRSRRNILRAFHRSETPNKLSIRELEADERVETSAHDAWQQLAILTDQGLVILVRETDPTRDAEPRYTSAVAEDRIVLAVLTALEAWDDQKSSGESLSPAAGR